MSFVVEQSVSAPFQPSANVVLLNVPCDATVYVGAAVRMDSLGVAYNALADSLSNSNVIGIVQNKASSVLCDIRVLGVTPAVFAGLDVTKEYFLSDVTAGLVTDTAPTAGAGKVILILGQPFSATTFLVNKRIRIVQS